MPRIRKIDGTRARNEQDKAEVYAQYLESVFQPNDIASELDMIQCQPLNETREKIRFFTPLEVAYEIDNNIIPKKDTWFRLDQPTHTQRVAKEDDYSFYTYLQRNLTARKFPYTMEKGASDHATKTR